MTDTLSDAWSGAVPDTQPVPRAYRGVWMRTLLETPDLRDDSTFVRWLQLGRWHADLRVPQAARRGPAAGASWPYSESQLALLRQQQGFCGVTQVESRAQGEVCTWHRLVDYQPPGPSPDAGLMVFETPDRVIETGVHGVYREIWQRLPDSSGPYIALAEPARADGQASTRLFIAGQYLMRVRPRTQPGPEFEISFGRIETGRWHIEQSTQPELEGQSLAFALQRRGMQTAQLHGEMRAVDWDILDWEEG
jgi:hypothetical protein